MYIPGTKIKVGIRITLGEEIFEPGLRGEITGSIEKMVGKAYIVRFEDGREAQIHGVLIKNNTEAIEDSQ
jgi:hypothetical protein